MLEREHKRKFDIKMNRKGISLSPRPSKFGPLFFAGKVDNGLENASKFGFDVVELSLRYVDDIHPDSLNERLVDLDLRVSAIATGQACLFDALCLGSENDDLIENTITHLKRIVTLAVNIRSQAVIIGGIRGRLPDEEKRRNIQFPKSIDAFRKCAQFAEDHGITLLIEPINRYETNYIHTAQNGMEILKLIGVNSAKLLLDTFHMNIEEANMLEAFRLVGNRLGYVHFADNNRLPPGQGQINFREILKVLDEIAYSGPIVVEALPLPDSETAVRKVSEFWKEMFSD